MPEKKKVHRKKEGGRLTTIATTALVLHSPTPLLSFQAAVKPFKGGFPRKKEPRMRGKISGVFFHATNMTDEGAEFFSPSERAGSG